MEQRVCEERAVEAGLDERSAETTEVLEICAAKIGVVGANFLKPYAGKVHLSKVEALYVAAANKTIGASRGSP